MFTADNRPQRTRHQCSRSTTARSSSVTRRGNTFRRCRCSLPEVALPYSSLRRVILILLALATLAPSVVRASALYQCAVDGEVRAACCCPAQAKHHQAPASNTELNVACCCKVTQLQAHESSIRSAPPVTHDTALFVAPVAVTITPIEAPIRAATIEVSRAQRGPPDPLFVLHCSRLL